MSFFTKRYYLPGTRPGTLALKGLSPPTPPRLSQIDYSDTQLEEITPGACLAYLDQPTCTWIHIQGDTDPNTLKMLTFITAIFILLTFIAAVYGMNFGNKTDSSWAMPELNWYYGYPLI